MRSLTFFAASMASMAISMVFRAAFALTHHHWCIVVQIIFVLAQFGFLIAQVVSFVRDR